MQRIVIIILLIVIGLSSSVVFAQMAFKEINQDSSLPINVEADSLTLNQKENKAVFSGNVVAVQENVSLNADEMTVDYHTSNKKKGNAISSINAKGSVKLLYPEREAESEKGYYDVDNGLIVLIGDVVLKRGSSILRGDKFVYDINKGVSQIFNTASADSKPGATTGSTGRVRGTFVPNEKVEQPKSMADQRPDITLPEAPAVSDPTAFIPIPVPKPKR